MGRNSLILVIGWLVATSFVTANTERKTIHVGGFEREYLIYTPNHPQREKVDGIIICLHGFGRTNDDFFGQYDISGIAESLNMIIAAPQALSEQDPRVILDAEIINSLTDNSISLHSVWGCGLNVRVSSFGMSLINVELNKEIDDVAFIDRMIDTILSDHSLPDQNIFMLGTSMGGFMTYQYALRQGDRLSGIISIAGSMGLAVEGMDYATKIPVCDFHSMTDEVVFYNGSQAQFPVVITLAMPKTDVINYWVTTNSASEPVTEPVQYYPSTNDITVVKITYPDKDNEVIHYKIDGASHNYFFKKEEGDCMDHVEEITRFIQSHISEPPVEIQYITVQKLGFYPNPVQNMIYMDTESGIVSIFDLAGQTVFTQSFTHGTVDLSSLKPGMYIIQLQSENTNQVNHLIKK